MARPEWLLLVWLAVLLAGPARADFSGRVVNVVEGDLLDVRQGSRVVRIRLADIDAPDLNQRFGPEARKRLHAISNRKTVQVQELGMDLRGYTVARVTVNGQDLGLAQLQAGMAWQAERSTLAEYRQAETEARRERKGLWRDLNPVPPWVWLERRQGSRWWPVQIRVIFAV